MHQRVVIRLKRLRAAMELMIKLFYTCVEGRDNKILGNSRDVVRRAIELFAVKALTLTD